MLRQLVTAPDQQGLPELSLDALIIVTLITKY